MECSKFCFKYAINVGRSLPPRHFQSNSRCLLINRKDFNKGCQLNALPDKRNTEDAKKSILSALERLNEEIEVDSGEESDIMANSSYIPDSADKEFEQDTAPPDFEFDEEIRTNKEELLQDEDMGNIRVSNHIQEEEKIRAEESEAIRPVTSRRRNRKDGLPSLQMKVANNNDESFIPDELLPRVAVVGRPNVGKSALFNRIVGKQVAIVYDYPGVTRDRLYTRASWGGRDFMVIDTGGLMSESTDLPTNDQLKEDIKFYGAEGLPSAIERQAAAAIAESDVLVQVVDGQIGLTAADQEVLQWLRKNHTSTPLFLAVNKCDNVAKADEFAADFWETGLEPIALSAISGSGTADLLDKLSSSLPPPLGLLPEDVQQGEDEFGKVNVAIVGRPNVGKSSILNALVGKERSIVSSMSGTTRDAVDSDLELKDGRKFTLIDTAGVRRRASLASTKDGAEPLSVDRALKAIRRADVAVLVVDAIEGITQQDFRLAEFIASEGKACVVAVNKWDAVQGKTQSTLSETELNVRAELRPVEWANIVFTSAKTGQRIGRILDAVTASAEEHRRRITTATLNLVIQDATGWRQPPSSGNGRRGRIYYGTQTGVKPPTFVMFCNDPKLFGPDYHKYMDRQFRENVGFMGTPLRLYWRGKG